jgi:hypothetical protein
MENIKVTSISDIDKILDYIHDRVFQLSDINWDQKHGTLSIPFTVVTDAPIDKKDYLLVKTWKNAVVESVLIIRNVLDYTLKDDAQIGEANVNNITEIDNIIVITCSVPVKMNIAVTGIDVELQLSDMVVQKISRFSIF